MSGSTLIGRLREIEALSQCLDAAGRGESGVVLLAGEPGIGKTRLLNEFSLIAKQQGWLVLSGRAYDTEGMPPYLAFAEAIGQYLKSAPDADAASRLSKAAREVAFLVPELRADVMDSAPQQSFGSEADRYRLFEAVSDFFLGLSASSESRGLLLCFDDLHWADRSTLLLFQHLTRKLGNARMLVAGAYRTEDVDPSRPLFEILAELTREQRVHRLALTRLSRDETAAMVMSFGDSAPVAVVEAIHQQSDGNPFFVQEIVRHLQGQEAGLAGAATRPEGWGLAEGVRQVIGRRVARLNSETQRLLECGAVLGDGFDVLLLRSTAVSESAATTRALEEGSRAGMVCEDGTGYAFGHPLIRQVIYEATSLARRQELHFHAAQAIETIHAGHIDRQLGALATHYWLAGNADPGKALVYGLQAGGRAATVFAFDEAVRLYGLALDAAERTGESGVLARRGRGMAHEQLGDFDKAQADYEAVLSEATKTQSLELRCRALLDLGMLWASKDYARTGEYLEQASVQAQEIGDPTQIAHSVNRVANWLVNVERAQEGIERHQEALAIFQTLGDKAAIASTLDLLGMAACVSGDLVHSAQYYRQAIPLLEELNDGPSLASSLATLLSSGDDYLTDVSVSADAGLDLEALADRALSVSREIGQRSAESYAQWQRCVFFGTRGEYGKALATGREGLAIAIEIGHVEWEVGCRCALGAVLFDLLDYAAATEQLEAAFKLAGDTNSLWWAGVSGQLLAQVLIAKGDLAEAEEVLTSLGRSDEPWTLLQRQAEAAWAQLSISHNDPVAALSLIDRLIEHATNLEPHTVIPRLWRLRAKALSASDKVTEAGQLLSEAIETCVSTGARSRLWRLQNEFALIHGSLGNRRAAEDSTEEARLLIEALANEVGEEPLASNFRRMAFESLSNPPTNRSSLIPARPLHPDGLTEREVEVLRLIASGKSGREIGEDLVLSVRTVERHIANIYLKTNTHGRAQVATYAIQKGLT